MAKNSRRRRGRLRKRAYLERPYRETEWERRAYAEGVAAALDDLPDGAYFEALREHGVEPEDLRA